jgi:inorganic pyrophosphatase
VARKH